MTDLVAKLPEVMDSTMLTTWRGCNHKFFIQHCLNLTTTSDSVDLHFGGAIARGLEVARKAYFVNGQEARHSEALGTNAACLYYGDFAAPEGHTKTWDRCMETMVEYFKNWPIDQDPVRPIKNGIEYSFAWPIDEALRPDGAPWLYGGRLDMLADWSNLLYVVDEKTTGQAFSKTWHEQWEIRNQFMGYVWGAQRGGYNGKDQPICKRALVRGICIQKTKVSFLPAFATFEDYMLHRWYEQTVRDLNTITAQFKAFEAFVAEGKINQGLDQFDRNLADYCYSYFKPCIFKIACTGSDPFLWLRDSGFQTRIWDPLRQNPIVTPEEQVAPSPAH